MLYYQGIYWNDYEKTRKYLNRLSTGESDLHWGDYIKKYCKEKLFAKALIPHCGDGHIERMLIQKKIIKEAVGTDWSENLLSQASQIAKENHYPIQYVKIDTNTVCFPDEGFDLIVNHAACHHIQYIFKVFFKFYQILKQSQGFFINYDYVGPHRNQYPAQVWERVFQLNQQLPSFARIDVCKAIPHLPTMILTDPTEAIHSELIKSAFKMFFDIIEYRPLGGAIAYPLLTHNKNFSNISDLKIQNELLDQILFADEEWLNQNPDSELFAFFVGRPKYVLNMQEVENALEAEYAREYSAAKNQGYYYDKTLIAELTERIQKFVDACV